MALLVFVVQRRGLVEVPHHVARGAGHAAGVDDGAAVDLPEALAVEAGQHFSFELEVDGETLDLSPLLADLLRRDARWLDAREIAAIMAGVRKGLEVLFAPSPKQIDRAYADDEMFIG